MPTPPPPDNAGFMAAAYVVCAVLLIGYAVFLAVRIRRVKAREP